MANMEQSEENVTVSQLHGLIKQKRNAELKSLLLQEMPSSLMNKQESTLMHAAVMFNNVDVIALLFGLGFNINARNSIGQTPLMVAAQNNYYQAVQLLSALDADILVADNEGANALQVLLQKKKNTPTQFIANLFERLKRSELSSSDIVNELVRAGCPLRHVFMFNNAEITREMLVRTNEQDEDALHALLKQAMYTMDMVNAKVLLEYKPYLSERRHNFFHEVTKNIFDPATKPFFKQLVNWNVIDEELNHLVEKMFRLAGDRNLNENEYRNVNGKDLQSLLDIGVDEYCREKFDTDLRVSLFANFDIDVVELVKYKRYDVDVWDRYGESALHLATKMKNLKGVNHLLDIGANPNIRNHQGRTPLFYAEDSIEIIELLLDAGADFQAMDKNNEFAFSQLHITLIPFKIITMEYEGALREQEREWLHYNCDQLRRDIFIKQVEWMKTHMVSESINLFQVRTEKFDQLSVYVKEQETCQKIHEAVEEKCDINAMYSDMLLKNLKKACDFNEIKRTAAEFLCRKMQMADYNGLVMKKIIGFLSYRDLLMFEDIEED